MSKQGYCFACGKLHELNDACMCAQCSKDYRTAHNLWQKPEPQRPLRWNSGTDYNGEQVRTAAYGTGFKSGSVRSEAVKRFIGC